MGNDNGHPVLGLARELFGKDGWEIADALARDDEAAVVELRRHGMRQLFSAIARNGAWERPGVVAVIPKKVPERRRPETLPGPALEPVGIHGSGWPGPDGGPPDKVWLTVNGFAAADVGAVELVTDLDRHAAPVQPDGSFLTLVRARRRQKLRIRLHLTTGETLEDSI